MDTSTYWQALNQLPTKAVGNIVNEKVLALDKTSCEMILKKILEHKHGEDAKRDLQMRERAELRNKLRDRHNTTMDLETYCGVRLGMQKKEGFSSTLRDNNTTEFSIEQFKNSAEPETHPIDISQIESADAGRATKIDSVMPSLQRDIKESSQSNN